jgi:ADP-dependent NAD(P)H-hydrate dehydratase / NAD(P)H-hydrate epimerase
MIPLLTAEEMRLIDRTAIEGMKIPSLDLMEAAGRGVADAMDRRLGPLEGRGVLVCCGRGNNGGDGFVVARRLKELGARPEVVVIGRLEDLSPDARVNAGRWEGVGGATRFLDGDAEVEAFFDAPRELEMAVDALLGTGSRGAPRGPIARAIRGLNALEVPLVAVDIPSGIDADTGAVPGDAVEADLTVTLAFPKRGHYLHPARARRGALEIVDIGIPREAALAAPVTRFLVEAADVRDFLPRWPGDAHKGDRGRLLVVGGSVGLTGAVALATMAAARGGAGLVTAGVPAGLNDILEVKLTEAMTLPLAEGAGRWLSPAALPQIRDFAGERLTAMVIGPGLSRNEEALELARLLVAGFSCPRVVDADALYAFRGRSDLLARSVTGGPLVLTPHPGEAEWLLGRPAAEIGAGRLELAAAWAQEHGQVLVLKGAPTVIGSPDGETFVNPTGGPALATGGTGDVLAGLIGAFLAQGLSPLRAAIAGVYLHGGTADLIAEKRSRYGLVAGDLVEALPEAMGEVGRTG